jgi:hypothetical protein
MKNSKGQLEIFGIAVIFLLFIFGLMIFIKLSSTKEENLAFNFMLEQMPSRLLQTMTETTTACQKKNIGALILDVASSQSGSDNAGRCTYTDNQIICDTVTQTKSKSELETVVKQIFENSLKIDKISYEFEIKMKDGCQIYTEKNPADGCSKAGKISAETFTLQSLKGKVDIVLKVC